MSVIATKLQATAGAAVLAAGLAITPAVAHAAPNLGAFSEGLGNSAELLIDPVVIVAPPAASATPGANKVAAANASTPSQVIQTFISGFVLAGQNALQAGVQYFGTWVYGGLAFTGLAFSTVGNLLGGNNLLTNIGDGFDAAANNVAKAIKIGPYSTSS